MDRGRDGWVMGCCKGRQDMVGMWCQIGPVRGGPRGLRQGMEDRRGMPMCMAKGSWCFENAARNALCEMLPGF